MFDYDDMPSLDIAPSAEANYYQPESFSYGSIGEPKIASANYEVETEAVSNLSLSELFNSSLSNRSRRRALL